MQNDAGVALVTGASRGIGRAAALELARRGHPVALVARNEAELAAVEAEISRAGGRALPVTFDLGRLDRIEELAGRVADELGQVEILVNNAAIAGPFGPSWEIDPAEWTRAIEINLISPFRLTRAMLPAMLRRGRGWIINISSGAARNPMERAGAYSTTKAGLDMLTRQLGLELAGSGVVAISLYPGVVDTAMQTEIRRQPVEKVGRTVADRFQNYYASGQLAAPERIGRLIARLAGPDGAAFAGQVISIADPPVQALLDNGGK